MKLADDRIGEKKRRTQYSLMKFREFFGTLWKANVKLNEITIDRCDAEDSSLISGRAITEQ